MLTAIKREINSNTIIIGNVNTPLSPTDTSSKQKINKETLALSDTREQIDIIDVSRTFHLKVAEYTFFSSAPRTFSRIDHILGQKSSLGKLGKLKSY